MLFLYTSVYLKRCVSNLNHWPPGIECEVGTRKKGSECSEFVLFEHVGAGLDDPFCKMMGHCIQNCCQDCYLDSESVGSSPISFMLSDFPFVVVILRCSILTLYCFSMLFRKPKQEKRRNRQRSFLRKTPIHRSCRCATGSPPVTSLRGLQAYKIIF